MVQVLEDSHVGVQVHYSLPGCQVEGTQLGDAGVPVGLRVEAFAGRGRAILAQQADRQQIGMVLVSRDGEQLAGAVGVAGDVGVPLLGVEEHTLGAAAQALQGVEDEDGIAEAVRVGGIQRVGVRVPVDRCFCGVEA